MAPARLLALLPLLRALGGHAQVPLSMRAVASTGPAPEGDFSKVVNEIGFPVPSPGDGQVLIKVVASSVNPIDWKLLTQSLGVGPKVLGFDVAGIVAKVGTGCTRLKVGDEVWADLGKGPLKGIGNGLQLGAWAEYAVADESQVGLKPQSIDFAGAASLPLVGLTDLQAFLKAGAPWAGKQNLTIVVTSGSGGTGTPAIQMARAGGAVRVVTAASADNAPLLKSLGATDVIDYHASTLWDALPENSVDVVYDNYGAPGTADLAMKVIRPGGVFIFLPGKGGDVSKTPKEGVTQINFGLCDSSNHLDLDVLAAMVDAGHLKPVISSSFVLEHAVDALKASMDGHVVGKVGLNITLHEVPIVV